MVQYAVTPTGAYNHEHLEIAMEVGYAVTVTFLVLFSGVFSGAHAARGHAACRARPLLPHHDTRSNNKAVLLPRCHQS
jgi:hypothetical protein